jgi:single-stranded-DNA-specific exonuclease
MAEAVARVWAKRDIDESKTLALASALDLSPKLARLLVGRGVREVADAQKFLGPTLHHIPDPFSMKGVDRASLRLADAIANKERITLYGDYDVDGVTSSALLASFLRLHGVEAGIYIPKRLIEGYGLNKEAVETLAAQGTQVLVTLDCGITASEEIARANDHGMCCIVVDHHKCPPALPPAYATLNPHQDDCGYPDKVLAAVGVCFNLIVAIRKVLRERGVYSVLPSGEPNLRKMLDLVALGTIADMVPLTGVNRVLTHFGLAELRMARRPGVRALIDVSGANARRLGSADVAFKLGPRINAAGRLDDASVGVRLLLADDMEEARRHAAALDQANGQRQKIEGDVFRAAVEVVDAMRELPHGLVLADETWHPGVVGIVASKLVERYDRPVILIGEGGRGSARTARGIHLYDALADVSEHLTKFGGHRAAAGLRIASDRIDLFRAAFETRVAKEEAASLGAPSYLHYDEDLDPEEIDDVLFDTIMRLEPFGNGNPEPLFRTRNVRVRASQVVGGQHLKLRLHEGKRGGLKAIAFKKADLFEAMFPGREIELAFHLERNEFQGFESLELRVRELRTTDLAARVVEPPPELAQELAIAAP